MSHHELDIIGPASKWITDRVHTFCKSLTGTAWGDVPPGRLVIATDLPGALRQYLPAERYQAWARRQRDRAGQALGVGMGFAASDGVPTAVVPALPESTNRAELLALCCHELCELSIDATSGEDRTTMNVAMSGLIWSEHVVERRRSEVFTAQQWPRSVLDQSGVRGLWTDYQAELPNLIEWAVENDAVPNETYGHWQIITREVVCAYGHAQAGNQDEERELEAFINPQPAYLAHAWLDLMIVCDRAFSDGPQIERSELDAIGEEGWQAIRRAAPPMESGLHRRPALDAGLRRDRRRPVRRAPRGHQPADRRADTQRITATPFVQRRSQAGRIKSTHGARKTTREPRPDLVRTALVGRCAP